MRTHRSRSAAPRLLAALSLVLVPAALAGCGGTSAPVATRTVTTTASAPPVNGAASPAASGTTSAPPSAASGSDPSPTAAVRVDPDAPEGQCADAALSVSVQDDPEAAGAGQRGAFVVLRNTGGGSCHLEGAPGLSLVGGGDGRQIGDPAERITSGARLVTLRPGEAALAQVQYTYVDEHGGNYSDGEGHQTACESERADGYRVYPPHSFRAWFSPRTTYACSTRLRWITVGPVRPASDFDYFTAKE